MPWSVVTFSNFRYADVGEIRKSLGISRCPSLPSDVKLEQRQQEAEQRVQSMFWHMIWLVDEEKLLS